VTFKRQSPEKPVSDSFQPFRVFVGHTKTVRRVIFSADAKTVYSCGEDEYVRVWDVESGKETAKFDHKCPVFSLALAEDGKTLLSVTSPLDEKDPPTKLWAWNLKTRQEAAVFPAVAKGDLNDVAVSPDGKRAATVSVRGEVCVWDIAGRKQERAWF